MGPLQLEGLSPRVRGNRHGPAKRRECLRSIPARAGEPLRRIRQFGQMGVYPRACGGTPPTYSPVWPDGGLSPRVRGNLRPDSNAPPARRSIPARAGEPVRAIAIAGDLPVYPRACGGTIFAANTAALGAGLSPRVRGNRYVGIPERGRGRSIPARAGEPTSTSEASCFSAVYPRACGGTRRNETSIAPRRGLSPRVRGNRGEPAAAVERLRSIPARAGEPSQDRFARGQYRVYPRACGGTSLPSGCTSPRGGLSPRVRGNHHQSPISVEAIGSIPARAGEPGPRLVSMMEAGVYPRACGGTAEWTFTEIVAMGLSPRVRGNPKLPVPSARWTGSIPARAGEPKCLPVCYGNDRVYPRACGGTPSTRICTNRQDGLSPRVRGNLRN